ncbi:EamA family transporter [Aliagarivorans marinus]|uniref:EamA family transporter n=1 Tax=Aliagarivorans marinus TaxID=561965 RepID=UPI000401142E|nr:EamA family transporter [Aliagarivorans marinus]
MSFFAAALVVFSALLHAGWNLLGKSNQGGVIAYALLAALAGFALLSPFIAWYLLVLDITAVPMTFWALLGVSGLSQAIYIAGLGMAYKQADIGLVYPVARAMPVLLVGMVTALLGQHLGSVAWLGFGLITVGCVLVPLQRFSQIRLSAYLNGGMLWAIVAALGTVGYSVADKLALDVLGGLPASHFADWQHALFYVGIQFGAMALPLAIMLVCLGTDNGFVAAWRCRRAAALTGWMMAATYGIVLYAMTMVENVSYVVALRQISIVFGLVLGVWVLNERWYHTRGVGVLLIIGGLVLALS